MKDTLVSSTKNSSLSQEGLKAMLKSFDRKTFKSTQTNARFPTMGHESFVVLEDSEDFKHDPKEQRQFDGVLEDLFRKSEGKCKANKGDARNHMDDSTIQSLNISNHSSLQKFFERNHHNEELKRKKKNGKRPILPFWKSEDHQEEGSQAPSLYGEVNPDRQRRYEKKSLKERFGASKPMTLRSSQSCHSLCNRTYSLQGKSIDLNTPKHKNCRSMSDKSKNLRSRPKSKKSSSKDFRMAVEKSLFCQLGLDAKDEDQRTEGMGKTKMKKRRSRSSSPARRSSPNSRKRRESQDDLNIKNFTSKTSCDSSLAPDLQLSLCRRFDAGKSSSTTNPNSAVSSDHTLAQTMPPPPDFRTTQSCGARINLPTRGNGAPQIDKQKYESRVGRSRSQARSMKKKKDIERKNRLAALEQSMDRQLSSSIQPKHSPVPKHNFSPPRRLSRSLSPLTNTSICQKNSSLSDNRIIQSLSNLPDMIELSRNQSCVEAKQILIHLKESTGNDEGGSVGNSNSSMRSLLALEVPQPSGNGIGPVTLQASQSLSALNEFAHCQRQIQQGNLETDKKLSTRRCLRSELTANSKSTNGIEGCDIDDQNGDKSSISGSTHNRSNCSRRAFNRADLIKRSRGRSHSCLDDRSSREPSVSRRSRRINSVDAMRLSDKRRDRSLSSEKPRNRRARSRSSSRRQALNSSKHDARLPSNSKANSRRCPKGKSPNSPRTPRKNHRSPVLGSSSLPSLAVVQTPSQRTKKSRKQLDHMEKVGSFFSHGTGDLGPSLAHSSCHNLPFHDSSHSHRRKLFTQPNRLSEIVADLTGMNLRNNDDSNNEKSMNIPKRKCYPK